MVPVNGEPAAATPVTVWETETFVPLEVEFPPPPQPPIKANQVKASPNSEILAWIFIRGPPDYITLKMAEETSTTWFMIRPLSAATPR